MPRGKMWFGTRGYETWVPAPAPQPTYDRPNWSTGAQQLLNGGANARDSKSKHNGYSLTVPPTKKRDAVRLITDFAEGVYDSQDDINLIYWIDPMAADKNVLNQGWATPVLASEDGVPLIQDANYHSRPVAVTTPTNGWGYPARSAQYSIGPAHPNTLSQYIPIPPGYSAWVGVHGDSALQDKVVVQAVNGFTTIGAVVKPTVLGVSNQLVNTEFASTGSSGIVLQFAVPGSDTTVTIYGLIVQILPTGQTPTPGNWISGQGHSGCQFMGKPQLTPYSSALDMVGAAFRLEETGMWL